MEDTLHINWWMNAGFLPGTINFPKCPEAEYFSEAASTNEIWCSPWQPVAAARGFYHSSHSISILSKGGDVFFKMPWLQASNEKTGPLVFRGWKKKYPVMWGFFHKTHGNFRIPEPNKHTQDPFIFFPRGSGDLWLGLSFAGETLWQVRVVALRCVANRGGNRARRNESLIPIPWGIMSFWRRVSRSGVNCKEPSPDSETSFRWKVEVGMMWTIFVEWAKVFKQFVSR